MSFKMSLKTPVINAQRALCSSQGISQLDPWTFPVVDAGAVTILHYCSLAE